MSTNGKLPKQAPKKDLRAVLEGHFDQFSDEELAVKVTAMERVVADLDDAC